MGKKSGRLKIKGKRYSFTCPIIKFEKKCFDWVCRGMSVTDRTDGYELSSDNRTVRRKKTIIKSVYFGRPYDYANNILFSLTEMLSNIVSFFRVIAIGIVAPAVLIGVVVAFFDLDTGGKILGIYAGVCGGLILASLALAGLGALWKKVFKLTEKTDERQVAAGYKKWSEYEDDTSVDYDYEI